METATQFAEQQFLGYFHAKRGHSLIDLIVSMGLSKKEWDEIKDEGNLCATDSEVEEIEKHFKNPIFK